MHNNTDNFIKELEQDFGAILFTQESIESDFIESAGGNCADDISYDVMTVEKTTAHATGFIFNHPYGATIRATFAKPVDVFTATVSSHGDEVDFEDNSNTLARAILAKLGNIDIGPDSELKAYASRA